MLSGTNVFISWTHGNPRTRDLGNRLPLEVIFINRRGNLLIRYIKQAFATWKALSDRSPETVVIMLPPFPLLLTAWVYAKLHGCRLVADMHTGAFNDPKWKWSLPLTLRLLRRQTAIVTNKFLADLCEDKDIRAIVLHDPIEISDRGVFATRGNTVLCPVSYANDEPIEEILEAARATPEVEWLLTGKAPENVQRSAPNNVTFTGFVDNEKFSQLMEEAGLVLALTTRPHTMQRAGYEALSYGIPQVTSDFSVLRDFLGAAATYTGLSGPAIAKSVKASLEQRELRVQEVVRIRGLRMDEQRKDLTDLANFVESVRPH